MTTEIYKALEDPEFIPSLSEKLENIPWTTRDVLRGRIEARQRGYREGLLMGSLVTSAGWLAVGIVAWVLR